MAEFDRDLFEKNGKSVQEYYLAGGGYYRPIVLVSKNARPEAIKQAVGTIKSITVRP